MGWRFRKSIKILPGFRLNFGKKGLSSATFGSRWFKTNVSGKGVRNTASLPGTGISHTSYTSHDSSPGRGGYVERIQALPIWFCPNCGFENVHEEQTCSYCKYFNEAYQPQKFLYTSVPTSNSPSWVAGLGGGAALAIVLGVCGLCTLIGIITPDRSASNSVQPARPVTLVSTPIPTPFPTPSPAKKGKNAKPTPKPTQDPLYAAPTAPAYSPPPTRTKGTNGPRQSGLIRGPRGGCYYINSRGNKTYVDRSLCN
jgi:hypothetical protein